MVRAHHRNGFTLIELLVVIAIIAVLIGLLLPAVQKVREAANRATCSNHLKQWTLAAHNYHDAYGKYPPGINKNTPDIGRRYNWVIALLAFVEQDNIEHRWNYTDFNKNAYAPDNTLGGPNASIALVFKLMVCPSDQLPDPPRDTTQQPPLQWALISYKGNGGSVSYPNGSQTKDGIFYYNHRPHPMRDLTDGTSNTLLFGERHHFDPIFDSDPDLNDQIHYWAWAYYSSNNGDIMCGTSVPINFRLPPNFGTLPVEQKKLLKAQRLNCFGSGHSGGANFALADGSVRFIQETISPVTYKALGTRAGGEVVGEF